jgi:hypothetical protein
MHRVGSVVWIGETIATIGAMIGERIGGTIDGRRERWLS